MFTGLNPCTDSQLSILKYQLLASEISTQPSRYKEQKAICKQMKCPPPPQPQKPGSCLLGCVDFGHFFRRPKRGSANDLYEYDTPLDDLNLS